MERPVQTTGAVLQLQSFSTYDGEGIRTVVFLPGCPLRCKWCANPETWTVRPKRAWYSAKCTGCGSCAAACPRGIRPYGEGRQEDCLLCGACVSSCEHRAITLLGWESTVEEIAAKISREELFYRYSGGGVTFSGGEPMVQHPFLRAIVHRLDAMGIHMWVETCGQFNLDEVEDIFGYLSHVFYDLKSMDEEAHRAFTGVSNRLILENAVALHRMGIPMTARIPCVKGANFTPKNLTATALFLAEELPGVPVELLPYHSLGKEKYQALHRQEHWHPYETPTREELAEARELFATRGVAVVSYR